jgi:hypothetical protein
MRGTFWVVQVVEQGLCRLEQVAQYHLALQLLQLVLEFSEQVQLPFISQPSRIGEVNSRWRLRVRAWHSDDEVAFHETMGLLPVRIHFHTNKSPIVTLQVRLELVPVRSLQSFQLGIELRRHDIPANAHCWHLRN